MLDSGEVSDGRNGCMQNDRLGVGAGPGKLMPFLVRKKSPKRTSNPLSFGPQIRNIGQGSARDIP